MDAKLRQAEQDFKRGLISYYALRGMRCKVGRHPHYAIFLDPGDYRGEHHWCAACGAKWIPEDKDKFPPLVP